MNPDVAYEDGSIIPVPRNSLEDLISDKVQQQEQSEQIEEIADIEEVKPITIEIANKKAILRHVKPQESKYWHFKFSDPRHTNQMTNVLQNIQGYRITVEYNFKLNTADIILKQQGEIVGKIHLLLCDKRDANLPNKYYCKLFFFHFKNNQLFQAVKTALVNFFENFKASHSKASHSKASHSKASHSKASHSKASHKRLLRSRKASLKSLNNKDKRATRRAHKYSLRPRKASLKSLKSLANKNVTKRAHKYSLRPRKVKPN